MAFIVLALPRSRTYWLSRFLSYGSWHCGHDELQHCRSLEDVRSWFTQPDIGTVETAAAPFWRLLPPDAKIVTVRRQVEDVLDSVMRVLPATDMAAMDKVLRATDRKLDQVERRILGVMRVEFSDLVDEATCAGLFEHCLPYPHDHDWWASWNGQRISGNLAAQVRYCRAYLPQIRKLERAAKQATLAQLTRQYGTRPSMDGFVFQEEPFERWLRDAQHLFRHHLAQTDQDADGAMLKNIPLGRQLDAAGVMQITTARVNGRMFGYVISLISPDADHRDRLMAQNLLPYASPDCPGLGRRLQSKAIELLRAKGIPRVVARTGIRGDGPRLGSLYERLGFHPEGMLYGMDLEDRPWA
jgi:GNAT superfamily N-acetyltransferase